MANCRSAAWWTMRTALDPSGDPDICLPDDEMLLGDLSAPQWTVTSSGRIQVESKDDIRKRLGRSTDDGDAVVQAFVPHLAEHVPNARPWAGSVDLKAIGESEDSRMRRRLAGAHGGRTTASRRRRAHRGTSTAFSREDDERPPGERAQGQRQGVEVGSLGASAGCPRLIASAASTAA